MAYSGPIQSLGHGAGDTNLCATLFVKLLRDAGSGWQCCNEWLPLLSTSVCSAYTHWSKIRGIKCAALYASLLKDKKEKIR